MLIVPSIYRSPAVHLFTIYSPFLNHAYPQSPIYPPYPPFTANSFTIYSPPSIHRSHTLRPTEKRIKIIVHAGHRPARFTVKRLPDVERSLVLLTIHQHNSQDELISLVKPIEDLVMRDRDRRLPLRPASASEREASLERKSICSFTRPSAVL